MDVKARLSALHQSAVFRKDIFQVEGMTCGHCERAVQSAIAAVDAQAQTQIDREAHQVVVHSSQARETLALAIAAEGYRVS
jgi:copper chaperone